MGEHDEHIAFEMGYNKGFKDGIKGSIPKDQYENRLKADMVAMLEDLDLLIDEFDSGCGWDGYIKKIDAHGLIQQKINTLREGKDG